MDEEDLQRQIEECIKKHSPSKVLKCRYVSGVQGATRDSNKKAKKLTSTPSLVALINTTATMNATGNYLLIC